MVEELLLNYFVQGKYIGDKYVLRTPFSDSCVRKSNKNSDLLSFT